LNIPDAADEVPEVDVDVGVLLEKTHCSCPDQAWQFPRLEDGKEQKVIGFSGWRRLLRALLLCEFAAQQLHVHPRHAQLGLHVCQLS